VIIFSNLTEEKIDNAILKKLGRVILKEEGIKGNESINCVFTDNKYIEHLNREYRGKNSPTDVITFSFVEGEGAEYRKGMFGDIYISLEMVRDNAKKYGQNFIDELKLLFVHGMLHLLGYYDEEEKDMKTMRSKERYYLNK